jgi:hypothetical protein
MPGRCTERKVMKLLTALTASYVPLLLTAQQVGNMTGAWRLDVDGSSWGNAHKPLVVLMDIDHREPILKYSG